MTISRFSLFLFAGLVSGGLLWSAAAPADPMALQKPRDAMTPGGLDGLKSHGSPRDRLIPHDRLLASAGLRPSEGLSSPLRGDGSDAGTRGRRNAFVNDPCLDPAPTDAFPANFFRTVQSETEIAVLSSVHEEDDEDRDEDDEDSDRGDRQGTSMARADRGSGDNDEDDRRGARSGQLMVAGYNDSYGFYDNRQGLSGFSYSTDGGRQWIDGGGLPPRFPTGAPSGTLGSDAYFGDPVVQVHHQTRSFYYASIYQNAQGGATLSVNRGRFKVAPRQVPVESFSNTRCEGNAALHGIPDPPAFVRHRIIWEPPVEAVLPVGDDTPSPDDDDFLDKEWLYVNQETGFLYLTYTRFGADGSTPIEMVRSFDGGQTWTPPSVVVPNLADTFNQATQPIVTPTGRVIVTWFARTFPAPTFEEREQRIEAAYSDDGGNTFGPPVIVDRVNPQAEPLGYNRARPQILNVPFIAVDKGRDDGVITRSERRQPGFGNVYITYFDGKTPLAQPPEPPTTVFLRQADILLARSINDGGSYGAPVKVNDDPGDTSHVFSSVHVNKHAEVFVTWQDRRVDRLRNLLTDTYGDISGNGGASFGADGRISTVSTDWITREDARPDYGDYNSGEVIRFQHFAATWADGRFPTPGPLIITAEGVVTRPADQAATPDSLFGIVRRGRSNDHTDRDRN